MASFDHIEVLSFDCYGTLIDWERGILSALCPVLVRHGIRRDDGEILKVFADAEQTAESGEYLPYREVLIRAVKEIGNRFGFEPDPLEEACLWKSLPSWEPFPDTALSLNRFKRRYRLGVLSNVDDDLFVHSESRLGIPLDWIITAQQVGSYKPAPGHFCRARQRIGLPAHRILHVAQSLYHDIVPAQRAGFATVWVNRGTVGNRFGATPPAFAEPDWEVPDLSTLAALLKV